ncbi:MAG: hypothetical protein ACRYG5_17020, partial [Janthinobacterium lividum]
KTGVQDYYLDVSRRSLNTACGYVEGASNWLSPSLLRFLSNNVAGATVGATLSRAPFKDDLAIRADLRARFGSLDAVLTWPDGVRVFEDVLRIHAAAVKQSLQPGHHAMIEYLKQEQVGIGRRTAIVDLGWAGTMQRSLSTLLREVRADASVAGFYYGLWPSASGNRYKAGLMEAAFASDFIPLDQQPEVANAVAILEELHTAPHGTVLSHAWQEGRWAPIYADCSAETEQYETKTRHFQEGALETVSALFSTGCYGTLKLSDLDADAVRAALGAICLSPSAADIALLRQLGHCASFDHACLDSIVCDACPADDLAMRTEYARSEWRPGTLRHWYDIADPAQRPKVRAFCRDVLSHLSERALRQFD